MIKSDNDSEYSHEDSETSPKKKRKGRKIASSPTLKRAKPIPEDTVTLRERPQYAVEVFMADKNQWQFINIFQFRGGLFDESTLMDTDSQYPLYFVLAIGCHKEFHSESNIQLFQYYVIDVSMRYCLSKAERNVRVLKYHKTFQRAFHFYNDGKIPLEVQRSLQKEIDTFHQQELSEMTISNLSHYKNHPIFAFERFLKRTEIIYPTLSNNPDKCEDLVLGWIEGEVPVYRRSLVRLLKSKEAWFQQGLVLIEDSIEPAKWVKDNRRKSETSGGKVEVSDPLNNFPLYGEWQVKKYEPSEATDFIVPKNEFNNIYYFKPWMLPRNTVHLTDSDIELDYQDENSLKKLTLKSAAAKLNIDYGEAVVGFEFSGGRARPKMNGIIICEEKKTQFMEGYSKMIEEKREKEIQKNKVKLKKDWKVILKKAAVLFDLERIYGKS